MTQICESDQPKSIIRQEIFCLAVFDTTTPIYDFYWKKLSSVADTLCKNDSLRVRFSGHCCIIGDWTNEGWDRNNKLACERAQKLTTAFNDTLTNRSKRMTCNQSGVLERVDKFECDEPRRPLKIPIRKGVTLFLGKNEKPIGRNWNRRVMITIEKSINNK